jgi:hypothetical protein
MKGGKRRNARLCTLLLSSKQPRLGAEFIQGGSMTNKRGNCGWAGRARRAVEELLTAGALILPLMGATAAQAQNYCLGSA